MQTDQSSHGDDVHANLICLNGSVVKLEITPGFYPVSSRFESESAYVFKIKYYKSPTKGHGRSWTLHINGNHRVRLNSPGSLTPMKPHIYYGSDEDCNRSHSLHLWPLFGIDVWWEPKFRPPGSGLCEKCKAELDNFLGE